MSKELEQVSAPSFPVPYCTTNILKEVNIRFSGCAVTFPCLLREFLYKQELVCIARLCKNGPTRSVHPYPAAED